MTEEGFVKKFIKSFIEEFKGRRKEIPGEKEVESIIILSDKLFNIEGEEEGLVTSEAAKVQELCSLTLEIIQRQGVDEHGNIDPDLRKLSGIFMYLRSHTIDKIHYLKRIRHIIPIILTEAKQCERYEELIKSFSKRKKYHTFRRRVIDEFDYTISAMNDIRKNSKKIDKAIKIVISNSENMRRILRGKYEREFGKMEPLSKILDRVLEYNRMGFVFERIKDLKDEITKLDEILAKQIERMPGLRENVERIEKIEKKAVKLIKKARKLQKAAA